MKFTKFPRKQKPSNTPPLISFQEMVFEFGVSGQKLRKLMGDLKFPAPKFVRRSSLATSNCSTYYNAKEVREWWKALNEQTAA